MRPDANNGHQSSHSLLAPETQCGDDLVIAQPGSECAQWNSEVSRVNAQTRGRPAGPKHSKTRFERRLRAKRLDRYVDAASSGQSHDLVDWIDLRIDAGVVLELRVPQPSAAIATHAATSVHLATAAVGGPTVKIGMVDGQVEIRRLLQEVLASETSHGAARRCGSVARAQSSR